MSYVLPILVTTSVLSLTLILGVTVFMYFMRRDILAQLEEESGIIVSRPAKRRPLTNKAPRIIDDATAYRIEQEQAERNSRDYR